ncbi:MAG: carboxypeptidase-like regulatory domain-containing protein, partial [Candidatus Staskawiczbacteria bacterium]|nr:carboxypeptidase-like regulatory domain-containing protein [Candidatus Staskawiczbacteria bacterium]
SVSINNGAASTKTRDVVLALSAGSNVARMSISNDLSFVNAVQEPFYPAKVWTLSVGQGQKTVYVKFFTQYGVASNIVSASIYYNISGAKPGEISYPPLSESVPQEPQVVFQGGNIISQKQFAKIDVLPLPQEIKNLAFKFPQFASTLEKVGISKAEDVEKLKVAQLSFPSLSEVAGVPASLALSKFTEEEKQKIPSNITFAKTGADNIGFNIKVSVSDLNKPIQSISTIQGKPLYLTVKPDSAAETVKGYIIFKSANSQVSFLNWVSKLSAGLSASLLDATNLIKNTNPSNGLPEATAQKDIVLSQFDYTNSGGIWTAQVSAPAVDGKYEIRTVVQYKEKTADNKLSESLSMILVVDPEGYIYEKTADNKETRIENAIVSIYWLNSDTKKYELWPAKDYQQQNPQTTDITGKYSFLVPPGTYKLKIESPDYVAYEGSPFQVQEGSGIHQNIELQPKNLLGRLFTIERVLMATIIIMLILVFASIVVALSYFVRRNELNIIK